MLFELFESAGSRKEKLLLLISVLLLGVVLLVIYGIVEMVKSVKLVHDDLSTTAFEGRNLSVNKRDLAEHLANEKPL